MTFEVIHPITFDISIKTIGIAALKLTADIVATPREWISSSTPSSFFHPVKPITNPMARYHPERAKVTREFIKNSSINH